MKNKYEIRGNVTAIFLNRKDGSTLETIIDTSDLEKVKKFKGKWYASWHPHTKSFTVRGNIKKSRVFLHRYILDAPRNLQVDHIKHNTLDNRREKLRLASPAENAQNRKGAYTNSKTGVRGVYWNKECKKWQAHITLNFKKTCLGQYQTLKMAEQVVKAARRNNMPFSQEAI